MTAEPLPSSEQSSADKPTAATARLLRLIHDLSEESPELATAVKNALEADPTLSTPRLHLVGRARKVSVSMPEDLTTAVQRRVGPGRFSQYVTEAVARQLELDLLGELSDLLREEHGPVPEDALAEARQAWPDSQ